MDVFHSARPPLLGLGAKFCRQPKDLGTQAVLDKKLMGRLKASRGSQMEGVASQTKSRYLGMVVGAQPSRCRLPDSQGPIWGDPGDKKGAEGDDEEDDEGLSKGNHKGKVPETSRSHLGRQALRNEWVASSLKVQPTNMKKRKKELQVSIITNTS